MMTSLFQKTKGKTGLYHDDFNFDVVLTPDNFNFDVVLTLDEFTLFYKRKRSNDPYLQIPLQTNPEI